MPAERDNVSGQECCAVLSIKIMAGVSGLSHPLLRALRSRGLWLLSLQPQLVQTAQERGKDHRAGAGGRVRDDLLWRALAIWRGCAGAGNVPRAFDRAVHKARRAGT